MLSSRERSKSHRRGWLEEEGSVYRIIDFVWVRLFVFGLILWNREEKEETGIMLPFWCLQSET